MGAAWADSSTFDSVTLWMLCKSLAVHSWFPGVGIDPALNFSAAAAAQEATNCTPSNSDCAQNAQRRMRHLPSFLPSFLSSLLASAAAALKADFEPLPTLSVSLSLVAKIWRLFGGKYDSSSSSNKHRAKMRLSVHHWSRRFYSPATICSNRRSILPNSTSTILPICLLVCTNSVSRSTNLSNASFGLGLISISFPFQVSTTQRDEIPHPMRWPATIWYYLGNLMLRTELVGPDKFYISRIKELVQFGKYELAGSIRLIILRLLFYI